MLTNNFIVEWIVPAVGLLLLGSVSGVLAGLLGVGGGIVIVPVLIIVAQIYGVDADVAMLVVVGTSLATIIPTSISSARAHSKRDAIDWDIIRGWLPAVVLGALIGGLVSKFVGSSGLKLVFGVVALLVSLNLALPKTLVFASSPPKTWICKAIGAFPIGIISALMGIGGGTISVPVMATMSIPVHRAVGTASVFGLGIALPAVAGFIWTGMNVAGRPPGSFGFVNLPAALLLSPTSILLAPVGASLAHSMSPHRLKLAFAVFLAISALRMLWSVSV